MPTPPNEAKDDLHDVAAEAASLSKGIHAAMATGHHQAFRSYALHFNDAIAAAEDDKLGEAIALLRILARDTHDTSYDIHEGMTAHEAIAAFLDKCKDVPHA